MGKVHKVAMRQQPCKRLLGLLRASVYVVVRPRNIWYTSHGHGDGTREHLGRTDEEIVVVVQSKMGKRHQLVKQILRILANDVYDILELLELWEKALYGAWLRSSPEWTPRGIDAGKLAGGCRGKPVWR
ncbi:hypothetical protein CYMTET_41887 [Cymbomonas tetramitiformis]|nr:hypothetical protein CYMTET_41887 [Cymbomonas tetramitiformis]